MRAATSAAIDYGLQAIELGEGQAPTIPAILLAQARVAARSGVSLDTVMRRYVAGYTLLSEFLFDEAGQVELGWVAVARLLKSQTTLFERLIAAVGQEHTREGSRRPATANQRLSRRLDRLLAGERVDTSDLSYEFSVHHLGVVAAGAGVEKKLRELLAPLDCRSLLDHRDQDTVWAWLGSRRRIGPGDLLGLASDAWPDHLSLAIGEAAYGRAGWRVTHEQAMAAHAVALCSPTSVVRYSDVVLLASALQDDLVATSLRSLFLAPLARERDGGAALKATLRAYLASERNISSTASALGVSRQTVSSRLHAIEERLERPLRTCMPQLEVALQLDELEGR